MKFRLQASAWELCPGSFGLGTLAWELWLGSFGFGNFGFGNYGFGKFGFGKFGFGSFGLGSSPWELSLAPKEMFHWRPRKFSLEALALELRLGNFRWRPRKFFAGAQGNLAWKLWRWSPGAWGSRALNLPGEPAGRGWGNPPGRSTLHRPLRY